MSTKNEEMNNDLFNARVTDSRTPNSIDQILWGALIHCNREHVCRETSPNLAEYPYVKTPLFKGFKEVNCLVINQLGSCVHNVLNQRSIFWADIEKFLIELLG